MSRKNQEQTDPDNSRSISHYSEIKLLLPDDLVSAWQRCSWILVHETKRSRLDIMEEMVRDFLIKHDC
jgi:hypothetical protein